MYFCVRPISQLLRAQNAIRTHVMDHRVAFRDHLRSFQVVDPQVEAINNAQTCWVLGNAAVCMSRVSHELMLR